MSRSLVDKYQSSGCVFVSILRVDLSWGRKQQLLTKHCRLQLKCDGTRRPTGREVKGKLSNGVGSQYPSHYLGTWCIQDYYRWCAHLGCQQSTELTPPADLNGLVRFAERRNLVSARVTSHFNWPLPHRTFHFRLGLNQRCAIPGDRILLCGSWFLWVVNMAFFFFLVTNLEPQILKWLLGFGEKLRTLILTDKFASLCVQCNVLVAHDVWPARSCVCVCV